MAARVLADQAQRSAAAPTAPACQVNAIDWRAAEASDFRRDWDAMALIAAEPNPFFESWYLLPALRAHDTKGEGRLLCAWQGSRLVGLVPLARIPRYYGKPLPHWASWIHGNCFLGAPLIARGFECSFWSAVLDWADSHAGSALFLHLPQMPLAGPSHNALAVVCAEQSRALGLVHCEERAMLCAGSAPDDYLEAAMTTKKRKELRRQFARLAELGELRIDQRRDSMELERWTEQFLELEHSGWKGSAGTALASHHATAGLFREALAGAASRGQLERLALWLDDQPVAMLATFLSSPGAFSYKTAFDERFARFSPGVLLQRANLAILTDPTIAWTDSCAAADHPMIDHIWRERRVIGRFSVAIGGALRRNLFKALLRLELGRNPAGATS
jgi:CelD/BcsL family acetyltransferase involved in cellulose biosynthesis